MYSSTPNPQSQYQSYSHNHLAYAPLSGASISTSTFLPSSRIPLDTELKPFNTPADRDLLDSLAELYSIIRTLDGLEKAYQKDALNDSEYNEMAGKLLKQYRSLLGDERVSAEFGSLEEFVRKWDVDAPRAMETLRVGLIRDEVYASGMSQQNNATGNRQMDAGSRYSQTVNPGPSATAILTATENFITFLDALRLNMLSKSALHPLLSDVIQSVNKVTDQEFEARGKIIQWLITLNGLKASEELSEEMAREAAFDIEAAYAGFKHAIS